MFYTGVDWPYERQSADTMFNAVEYAAQYKHPEYSADQEDNQYRDYNFCIWNYVWNDTRNMIFYWLQPAYEQCEWKMKQGDGESEW